MNREQRRALEKNGGNMMQSPCTITEAVQIARGVAEDVLAEYTHRNNHLQTAMSLQIELLKEIVFSAGLITEEDFKEKYIEKAKEISEMQQKAMEEALSSMQDEKVDTPNSPNMEVSVGDIEIKKD